MYSPAQLWRGLKRGVSNPRFFAREANRLYHRRLYLDDFNADGVDVVAEDWDNLLILDACRYDLFERRHDLPGRLEQRRSRGSHTIEFLAGNFTDRDLLDTVYVSASPQLYRWQDRIGATFHDVVHVWREDGWNEQYHTVLPETTMEYALEAAERYPDKRLVVHFLQPHYPFIDAGRTLNPRRFGDTDEAPDIWGLLSRGEAGVSRDAVRDAYRANFDRALPAVRDLLTGLDGRTVVSADHGNLFGERASPVPVREWGHPPGVHVPELVEVPWQVVKEGPRREISADPPERMPEVDEETVEDTLRTLGYVP